METFCGDTEESTEEAAGRKKSKIKSLKSRLFGRNKSRDAKLSQSETDITAGQKPEEDLECSQAVMGSRALSHDSIFLSDQVLTDAEPERVLSQENVHSKIKALQMKLQLQKMHLGPPPMVLPIRRQEEDESGGDEDRVKPASCPLSPIPKPVLTKSLPPTPSHMFSLSVPAQTSTPPLPLSSSSPAEAPLDFNSPVQFTPCLDTSAARHRMSIKPRNQRASSKRKVTVTQSEPLVNILNHIDQSESVEDEDQQKNQDDEDEEEEEEQKDEAASPPKPSPPSPFHVTTAPPPPPPILRVKPQRRLETKSNERPHSSFMESELKDRRDAEFDVKKKKTDVDPESSSPFGSVVALRSLQDDVDASRGIRRLTPGSGSFHFTTLKNEDRKRPRSGSFVETKESRVKTGGGEETRVRQEAAPWEKSLKRTETASKHVPTDGQEEEVDEAMEAKEEEEEEEEERRTAFGIKLRSTSQSFRLRSDVTSNNHTKREEPQKRQEVNDESGKKVTENMAATAKTSDPRKTGEKVMGNMAAPKQTGEKVMENMAALKQTGEKVMENMAAPKQTSEKIMENMAAPRKTGGKIMENMAAPKQTGEKVMENMAAPKQTSEKVMENMAAPKQTGEKVMENMAAPKQTGEKMMGNMAATTGDPKQTDGPKEAEVPPPPESEVSWMILAMEKTRSLQQLFRFPKDFSGMRQTPGPTETQRPAESPMKTSPVHTASSEDQTPQGETTPTSQPTWTGRSLRAPGREDVASGRRGVWGSVSEKAAALEKRAEGGTGPGPKGVDLKKPACDPPGEPQNLIKPLSRDQEPAEGKPGPRPAESSPVRDPDRWLRKNMAAAPSPSDGPSWMELAKRKSLAWSDKTMD